MLEYLTCLNCDKRTLLHLCALEERTGRRVCPECFAPVDREAKPPVTVRL